MLNMPNSLLKLQLTHKIITEKQKLLENFNLSAQHHVNVLSTCNQCYMYVMFMCSLNMDVHTMPCIRQASSEVPYWTR